MIINIILIIILLITILFSILLPHLNEGLVKKIIVFFLRNVFDLRRYLRPKFYYWYYIYLIKLFGFKTFDEANDFEEKYFTKKNFAIICLNLYFLIIILSYIYLLSLSIWTRAAGPRIRIDHLAIIIFKYTLPFLILIIIIIILLK
jgi:hypothetical protein